MDWASLTVTVEGLVRNVITDSARQSQYWDEDYITLELLRSLDRNLSAVSIDDFRTGIRITWSAHKFRGPDERVFGDLAIIVHIVFQDGTSIEGVAFLEAKRISLTSNRFDALDFNQLGRIIASAPRAMLLTYDDQDQLLYSISGATHLGYYPYPIGASKSLTAQASAVVKLQNKNRSIYNLSIPFSVQLCMRYLQGLDLEFDDRSLRRAKGYGRKLRRPRYLLVANVTHGRQEPYGIDFNNNLYQSVHKQE